LEADPRERMARRILPKTELRKFRSEKTRNLLDYLILRLLKDHSMHGYGILSAVRDRYGYCAASSVVYQLLSTFEEKEYVKSRLEVRDGKPRKVYTITSEGIAILDFEEEFLRHVMNLANPKVRERK